MTYIATIVMCPITARLSVAVEACKAFLEGYKYPQWDKQKESAFTDNLKKVAAVHAEATATGLPSKISTSNFDFEGLYTKTLDIPFAAHPSTEKKRNEQYRNILFLTALSHSSHGFGRLPSWPRGPMQFS